MFSPTFTISFRQYQQHGFFHQCYRTNHHLLQEAGTKKLAHQVESEYMRDKKLHEVDDDLFYSIDEKTHVIDITGKG